LFTTGEVDACLAKVGRESTRIRMLAALCADGSLVRVQRGLYAVPKGGVPDPYSLAAQITPDSVLGLVTALEVRGVLCRSSTDCIYFTRRGGSGPGPTWDGMALRPVSHPTALVRRRTPFVETEFLKGRAGDQLRVTTVERAVVDILARPWLTGSWPQIVGIIASIPELAFANVLRYLECLGNATTAAKAGWIFERLQEQFGVSARDLAHLEGLRPRGPHYLSRKRRESGRYIPRWNLIVPRHLCSLHPRPLDAPRI